MIPSGAAYPDIALYIGSGCVVNPIKVMTEIRGLLAQHIYLDGRLHISSRASVIQPRHILLDAAMGKKIGTTGNGIGPAYADRAYRTDNDDKLDIRMGDL